MKTSWNIAILNGQNILKIFIYFLRERAWAEGQAEGERYKLSRLRTQHRTQRGAPPDDPDISIWA